MKPVNKPWILIICCVCLCAFASMANAANMFMEIADIAGDSEDALHPGWIDVLSLQWSLDAAATNDKRGGGGQVVRTLCLSNVLIMSLNSKSQREADRQLAANAGRACSNGL